MREKKNVRVAVFETKRVLDKHSLAQMRPGKAKINGNQKDSSLMAGVIPDTKEHIVVIVEVESLQPKQIGVPHGSIQRHSLNYLYFVSY